jgi:hypothetical protein
MEIQKTEDHEEFGNIEKMLENFVSEHYLVKTKKTVDEK